MKKSFLLLTSLLTVMGTLTGCGSSSSNTTSVTPATETPATETPATEEAKVTYTVTLNKSMGGTVDDAAITVYDANNVKYTTATGGTNGVYTFEGVPSKYTLKIDNLADNYELEETYPVIEAGETEKTVTVHDMIPTDALYSVGDTIGDYYFTEAESGEKLWLSDYLKKNQFMVLNFWFVSCTPCRMDFMGLEPAYEEYKDRMDVFALSVQDSTADIKNYKYNKGLTFPMGKDTKRTMSNVFYVDACPTTVFVDKNGVIDFKFVGSITESYMWSAAFEHYLAEDYVTGTMTSSVIENATDPAEA